MESRIADLLSFCSKVDFGTVDLSIEEEAFRGELNHEMLSLCEQLPKCIRTEAVLFLMKYLKASFSGGLNFVNYFYIPAWSILFWLHHSHLSDRKPDPKYVKDAKTGHTMAMFLHAIDDHLADGQLPVTHLALLMRSQSWVIMNQAYNRIANVVDNGAIVVRDLIDDYYSSITTSIKADSLDSYCELFKKQMATWLIVPTLLARKVYADKEFSRSIQTAYTSFGIAWRLIDDLQDLEKDMMKGVHSSIYVCLNKDLRCRWDKNSKGIKNQNKDFARNIISYVLENRVIDIIMERACGELESAASIADSCGIPGFSGELRDLLKPLRNG